MTAPRNRSDELLEAWTRATARPIPAFVGQTRHPRRLTWVALVAIAIVIILGAVLGALAIGNCLHQSHDQDPPAQLAAAAVQAVATAPGVRYSLTIDTHYVEGTLSLDSSGVIDFQQHRFSGTADGGGGSASMLLFGGPSAGAVIVADGLFVQTEGRPWVHVPQMDPQLGPFMDRVALSNTLRTIVDSSVIDPAVQFAPCGTETCRVLAMSTPAKALFDAGTLLEGPTGQAPPHDLGTTDIKLLVDPSSGFPVRMDTSITAGLTTTVLSLQLTRLDPVPSIAPPVP